MSFDVSNDHADQISLLGNGSVILANVAGDTLYYGDQDVTSTNNQGTLTAGTSVTFTQTMWVRSASQTSCTTTYPAPGTSSGVELAGDLGGTSSSPIVETVNGGLTAINSATFLGASTVVPASGDTTGATDVTNINAALSGSNSSVYLNGSYYVNAPLVIPSNVTVVLADCYIKLVNSTNTPIFVNPSYDQTSTPAASNIHIRGVGRAVLDYNGANQTAQPTTPWVETAIMFCNVSKFSIRDIQTQNGIYVTLWFQACSDGRVQGIHCEVGTTDLGYIHADIGCSNIHFSELTANGNFPDAVFSMNSVANTAYPAVSETPYAHTLTGSQRYITGLSWSNITLSSGTGMFACFLDANGQCTDIDISNVHNTYTGSTVNYEFNFGPVAYHLRTIPVQASVARWRINGYTMGGSAHWFIGLDNPMVDIVATNIKVGNGGSIGGLIGTQTPPTGIASYYPQVQRIKLSDVSIPTLNSGGGLMKIAVGIQAQDIAIESVHIGTANGPLLNNAADVQGLRLSDVRVGTLNSNPFVSTAGEFGVVEGFQYDVQGNSLTSVMPQNATFRIGQPFPTLTSGDTAPGTSAGSEIVTSNTLDPTGGAATTGGLWVADGTSWNLVKSMNSVFHPSQIYRSQMYHFQAGDLKLSNGASVASWPDRARNRTLINGTGANQPTFVASDSNLNNRPSVSFNGSTDYLQNGGLNSFTYTAGTAGTCWIDIFIVYYWTTLANTIVLDAASSSGGSSGHGVYLLRAGANKDEVASNGGAGPQLTTLATNTAYITYVGVSSTGHLYIGDNYAARGSITNSSPGTTTVACTGLTLGAGYNGGSPAAVNIAEVVGYVSTTGGVIADADWATVMAGLATKYNVTLS